MTFYPTVSANVFSQQQQKMVVFQDTKHVNTLNDENRENPIKKET